MASDSEGEELGIIRPTLIRELRNVLEEYPDDGQILKEMIQNAEDAGASTVKFVSDTRQFNQEVGPTDIRQNPWLKFFKGPALYAYNDAKFTDRDWQGIRMIHTSIKEADPLQVGRFGLGFKSVFHLTDRLVIISGNYLLYMDPFKDEARCCILKKLSRTKPQERERLLEGLNGTFGVSEEVFLSGHYPGTVFWFPLRQEANDLSANVYSGEKVNDLWNEFLMEASGILLFLKKIESVELHTTRPDTGLRLDFRVGHAASCLESVRRENRSFIDGIMSAGGQIPASDVCNSLVKEVEITSYTSGQPETHREKWLVVNYHPGRSNMSAELHSLCEDPELSYKPFVGLASPLEGQTYFQGQIFCFLPLPPESRSPTGLPLHVNGYFALSQNRRHIKWPTADQLSHQAHIEPALRWNCLLVDQLLPACYAILLTRLKELDDTNSRRFYTAWPDVKTVTDRWQSLVHPLFVTMATKPMYLTEGGQWVELARALLSNIPEDVSDDVRRTVHKVYVICQDNLIILPQHVLEGLRVSGCLSTVAVTTPQRLSHWLQTCLSQFQSRERHLLLSYLCHHGDFSLLDKLQLLPLQDGAFGNFTSGSSPVFVCREPEVRLFPGLEAQFCSCELPPELRKHLHDVAVSGLFSLRMMVDEDVDQLLMKSIQVRFGSHEPRVSVDNDWLQDVWHFLNEKFSENLQDFLHIPLLPFLVDDIFVLKPLEEAYVCGQVSGMDPVPDSLATCLSRLGITVFPHLPEYVTRHPQVLGRLVQWPSAQGIVSLLSRVSDDVNGKREAVFTFNQTSTEEDRACLVKLLDDCPDMALSSSLQNLLQQLNLFPCLPDNTFTTIACVQVIAPDRLPPVPVSRQMLVCQGSRDRELAVRLGGHEESLVNISRDILQDMQPGRETHLFQKKQEFMEFFLDELLDEKSLHQLAKKVRFLSSSSEPKAVEDLYEPSHTLLREVFKADLFPCGDDDFIKKLQKLGLRDESQVSADEILEVAEQLDVCCNDPASIRRANSFWILLTSERLRVDLYTLRALSRYRCLPVLHANSGTENYPCELPMACPEEVLLRPEDVYPHHHLFLVGSVAPVVHRELGSHKLLQSILKQEPSVETVLEHLANITKFYNSHNCLQFRAQLNVIYRYFDKHRKNQNLLEALMATPCLLVESEATFLLPSSFWIENNPDDIELRPYRFRMSTETSTWQNLFVSCGTSVRQDCRMLLEVLSEIKAKYQQQTSQKHGKADLKLVLQILQSLKDFPSEERKEVILPVAHPDQNVLLFRPAIECTVADALWLLEVDSQNDANEDVSFVHPSVPKPTALALGALGVMDRALDETEDIDYGYHQGQPLTTQLHNLLEDYTDGFSVSRELIQNADDAGATEVKFLLDERQNEDCREHLLNPEMASLQGPAFWVYNDATFSDQDFENITRLGASTKKNDASKVGKFGLGFNAVYNLTDVPCFLSRHTMAWFDPHKRHLPRKNLGMRIDLSLPKNRNLVKLTPSQFKPFEGVFGCSFQEENFTEYTATLFRLPFRSEAQAAVSRIKMESYSPEKRRQLLAMLMERAGNLLVFSQNVMSLEVFHLPPDAVSPTSMTRLMSTTKQSQVSAHGPQHGLQDHTESILKVCTRRFQDFFQTGRDVPDVRVTENVIIAMDVTPEATTTCDVAQCQSQTKWLITWASGTNQSVKLALDNKEQGLIPLAAAAVPLDGNKIMSMNKCPFGFYRQGHLFCFLPLPEQIQQPFLPVHVNGTFALTSSRQNLLITTDENIDNRGGNWNKALFSDAVCRSYLLLLESLQTTVLVNPTDYYQLWPRLDNSLSLAESFYACVVNDHFRVFPCQNSSVSFQEAGFLDIWFRRSDIGDLAFQVVSEFWENQITLVDIPDEIYNNFIKSQQTIAFNEKCLTEEEFYETFFFPSIASDFWKTSEKVKVRDTLTRHAVVRGSDRVKRLVSDHACIPCQVSRDLRKPYQLVHPQGEASALFLPADGRFPQTASEQDAIDFCQRECLESLMKLGMAYDDLSWEDVVHRARSVKDLMALDTSLAITRAHNLIDYLAMRSAPNSRARIQSCPADVKEELSVTEFLPVLSKPSDWPFPWFDEGRESLLAAPSQLYDSKMTNLVACSQKIFANTSSSTLRLKTSEHSRREVLGSLQLVTREQSTGSSTVEATVKQLLSIAKCHESHPETSSIQLKTESVCYELYSFLQECIRSDKMGECQTLISDNLRSEQIIWTDSQFCHPSKLAFSVKLACPPYLQEIRAIDRMKFKTLFQFLGVREKFGTQEMLAVIDQMRRDVGEKRLTDEEVESFSRAAQLFCYARNEAQDECPVDPRQVFLPDREGFLRCVDSLCLDDTPRLKPKPGMFYIHDKFSVETAKTLGVKTKNSGIFRSHMRVKSFGQAEKLTNRIRRLLQGYTCDVSIFKEFIQNADDAGATEIRFIKDFRRLGTDSVPDGWQELQGPALCVYNNADFTSRDIEGIQNLGEGSKGEEMMKTGQFGVGFNAVYHITDVPSFWTRRDGQEQVICVCDPCRVIPNEWPEPGMELENIESLKEEYPDLLDGYLCNVFDASQPGTLFRLPLRTKWMAGKSAIHKEPMTDRNVSNLLTDFVKEASLCLLFLNKLRKVGIYSTKDGRVLDKEYEVEMVIDQANAVKKEAFYTFLKEEGEKMIDDDLDFDIREINYPETVINFTVKDSTGVEENWVQVSRAGFLDASHVPGNLQEDWRREHFRLLPRGGVAVKMQRKEPQTSTVSAMWSTLRSAFLQKEKLISRVFCTLPLPVETSLPFHINGDFALEHESRRDVWNRKGDSRTAWNRLICAKVVAPAYIKALDHIKAAWFGRKQIENQTPAAAAFKIPDFFALFPSIPTTDTDFWSPLAEGFYQQVISGRHPLFPVTRSDSANITWTSVWKDSGFAGYFTRPLGYVPLPALQSSQPQQHSSPDPVSLPAPPSSQPQQQQPQTPPEAAVSESDKHLAELLKRVNMKIVEAPLRVYAALRKYGAGKMQEATVSTVIAFLKSCTSNTPDSCKLKNLPQPLCDLELSENDILNLTKFVQKSLTFSSEIAGLPLCLLQSGTLDVFSGTRQPFVTRFHELLPGLSEEFLHQALVAIYASVQKDVPNLLRIFDIKDLADRLSTCLVSNHFKTGQPCSVDNSLLPHSNWIALLWDFLSYKLRHKSQDTEVSKALQWLHQWSLIPCKIANSGKYMLYPVQDRGKVLFLPQALLGSPHIEVQHLASLAQKLPLPILNEIIVCQTLAEKLVGSFKYPESIMHILKSFKAEIVVDVNDAWSLLNYFAQNIRNQPSVNWSCLREIPMFCTVGGRTTSLDSQAVLLVPEDIPRDGLEVWSQATKITLLDPRFLPDELCELLGLNKSSNLHMAFWSRFLATLNHLPQNTVDSHILYIRDNCYRLRSHQERQNLFAILSRTAFVSGCNRMFMPVDFYSPHHPVFKQMCTGNQFPPKPYCELGWRNFMEEAGMKKDVTSDMFIMFARQVEAEGINALSQGTCIKSSALVKFLLESYNHMHSTLLSQVRNIRFARPWSFQLEHKALAKVCPPFASNRLVSFSESCRSCHWPLLWSAAPLLHPDDDPHNHVYKVSELQNVLQQLQFEQNVPMQKFLQHVSTLCQKLTSSSCDILRSGDGRKEVEWLLEQIYMFVAKLQQNQRDSLRTVPVVFDSQNGRLLYPDKVVINLRWDDAIDGWLFRAPTNYDKFYGLFQSLGVAASVTADHYARVLTKLRAAQQNQPLAGDMLQTCKKAVQGVFRCLQTSDQLSEKVLYLPNEQWCLKESTCLIFNDNPSLRGRLQHRLQKFFLGFEQLGIDCASTVNQISRLPEQHKMRLLSKITTEGIPRSVTGRAKVRRHAKEFKMKLSSVGLVNGVTRLLYHQHVTINTPFSATCRKKIRKDLETITILDVKSLHMVLIIDNEEIPGSESYCTILRDESPVHRVFVDSEASFSDDNVVSTLVDVIIEAVSEDLRQFRSLLISMMTCPDVQALLDQHEISYFSQTDTCKPGCYVSVDDVCLLQNNVTSLYMVGEDVALEVCDPLIHTEERAEAGKTSHQVFVYARVVGRLSFRRGHSAPPPCCMSYKVDIGNNRTVEVVAIRLYKVTMIFDEKEASALPFSPGSQAPDHDPRPDEKILHEIKSCLEVCLPLLGDRRLQLGLFKRLCLQWHPEVNSKRRPLCQNILEVVKQFARYNNLSAPRGNSTLEAVFIQGLTAWHQASPVEAFFDQVHERGRLYASQSFAAWQGRSDLAKQQKRKNPQPGEGHRWLRQALSDLRTAQSSTEKNNWHCLMCHQAAEKALKAVLFHRDADNQLLVPSETAELKSLAAAVGNTEMTRAVEGLERLTGDRWRMSYPFVQWAPDTPSLLYTADTVRSACSLTEIVVNTASSLLA